MQIEFDPAKDLVNQAEHGVSLALAVNSIGKPLWVGLTIVLITVNCV